MIRSIENNVYNGADTVVGKPAPTQAIKPRSEAQREASRINGRRSRGPKTELGKNRSRRNALKHGIRAEKLGPPSDVRGLDREYRDIHAELVNEFEPVTFTERVQVDTLARDIQRLHLADQMIDAATTPPLLRDPKLKGQYQTHRRARRDERLAASVLVALRCGETPDLKPAGAERLAELVVNFVTDVEQEMDEAADELDELNEQEARGELSDSDRVVLDDLREYEAQQQLIQRCRRVLRDADRLAEGFRGDREIKRTERRSLIGLLADLKQYASYPSLDGQEVEERLKQAAEAKVLQLAADPTKLITLEQYRERLARSMRRQMMDLKASCL